MQILDNQRVDALALTSTTNFIMIGYDQSTQDVWIVDTIWGQTTSNWKIKRSCESVTCDLGGAQAIVDGNSVHTAISMDDNFLVVL